MHDLLTGNRNGVGRSATAAYDSNTANRKHCWWGSCSGWVWRLGRAGGLDGCQSSGMFWPVVGGHHLWLLAGVATPPLLTSLYMPILMLWMIWKMAAKKQTDCWCSRSCFSFFFFFFFFRGAADYFIGCSVSMLTTWHTSCQRPWLKCSILISKVD